MRIYINILLGLLLLNSTSCKDWLDLQPEAEATEDQVFSTGEGFRSVLNGLYQAMGTADLYGRELSWGMLDCMSQQYTFEGGVDLCYRTLYPNSALFKYTDNNVSSMIEDMWRSAFNIVANANNLIQNLEKVSPDLFAGHEMERNMILGEAYACRGLMQFDLLRVFAPAPVNDDGANYVPYVDVYPNIQANGIAVKPYLDKVIADLEKARTLVMEFDTSALGKAVSATGEARFQNSLKWDMEGYNDYDYDYFFRGRGYRLSYYSITALLARVYQYADRHREAFKLAKEIAEYEVEGDYYTYQLYEDDFDDMRYNTLDTRKDLKVISNLIFAVYNEKAYDENELEDFFKKASNSYSSNWLVINKDNQKVFFTKGDVDESKTDFRGKYMLFLADGQYPLSAKWYLSDNEDTRNQNVAIQPMIRATEMQYIMAESYAREGNWGEAQKILTTIRTNRGCTEPIRVENWNSFVEELIRDARREWIAEGQLFFLYKRLNADVDFGKKGKRPLQRSEYLVPIPTNQSL